MDNKTTFYEFLYAVFFFILAAFVFIGLVFGYIKNLYLTTQLDFERPYKAEVFRTARS